MQDRPTALELLDAVRQFVERDVVEALDGTRRFHARVAANVLAIVARELRDGDTLLRNEWRRLTALLAADAAEPHDARALGGAVAQLNADLAARIRAGDADREPFRGAVLTHLRATADEKLRVANPAYLGERP
jgi:hypothetical protein